MQNEKKTTTISVFPKLLAKAKKKAKENGMTFSGYIGELIKKDLKVKRA